MSSVSILLCLYVYVLLATEIFQPFVSKFVFPMVKYVGKFISGIVPCNHLQCPSLLTLATLGNNTQIALFLSVSFTQGGQGIVFHQI